MNVTKHVESVSGLAFWVWSNCMSVVFQDKREKEAERKRERKRQLHQLLDQINLWDQTKRNAARAQQQIAEISAYEKQFGWVSLAQS